MALPTSGITSTRASALAVVALGVLAYPAYIVLGEIGAGIVYAIGLIPVFMLVIKSPRDYALEHFAGTPPARGLWAGLGVFALFIIIRLAESRLWGGHSVYVLEKLVGLGVLALVLGGGYPFLSRPRYPGASIAAILLFLLGVSSAVYDCYSPVAWRLAILLVPLLVVNSLFEEGLFRGLLLRTLATKTGPSLGVLGQALLFSLWHLPHVVWDPGFTGLYYLAATFLVGLSLGVVALIEGGVVTPVLVHTIWNLGVMFSCSGMIPLVLSAWGAMAFLFIAWGKVFRKRR